MNHIIVVGAGTAGMCCAIRAAELGAKVLVIEKDSLVGGTLHVTAGHMSGGGTKRQAEKGIEDSPTLHFEDVMQHIVAHLVSDDGFDFGWARAPE